MFDRFTDAAIEVMVKAQMEARRLGHNFVDIGHIMLALIDAPGGIPGSALANAEPDYMKQAREEVGKSMGPGTDVVETEVPFTFQAKRLLELSFKTRTHLQDEKIDVDHLLIALLVQRAPSIIDMLTKMGVDCDQLEQSTYKTARHRKVAEYLSAEDADAADESIAADESHAADESDAAD